MITLEEACKISYETKLRGAKYTRIKETEDSYIICFVSEKGEKYTAPPYRISKEDGRQLPFVLPEEKYFKMFDNGKDVEIPNAYKFQGAIE